MRGRVVIPHAANHHHTFVLFCVVTCTAVQYVFLFSLTFTFAFTSSYSAKDERATRSNARTAHDTYRTGGSGVYDDDITGLFGLSEHADFGSF